MFANDNAQITRAQDCLTREALVRAAADVRILDCYTKSHTIQVQNGAPEPHGRGVSAYQTSGRFEVTDRAWSLYKLANPHLNIVTDF